jgi:hypothetical protein
MLMISNIGSLACLLATGLFCASAAKSVFWNVTKWLSGSIQDGFFLTAHWILASKYNQIASEIPYLLHEVSIPAS